MKVSVIIPVRNAEDYLAECLSSVLSQTYKDFEVLCVDDGSTDSSFFILENFQKSDDRVVVLRQSHSNAGTARNLALSRSRGTYLAFLDADDYYEPNMLECMVSAAETNSLDIVLCKSYFVDDKTKKRSNHDKAVLAKLNANTVYSAEDLWGYAFRYCVGWPWDKLFRRSFIERHDLTFQELESTNDAYFVFIALALADRFMYINNRLVNHRVGNLRSIENTRDRTWMNTFLAVEKIRDSLTSLDLLDLAWRDFGNWIVEMCLWNLSSLRSSRSDFYNYVQANYAKEFACQSREFFYDEDCLWKMKVWASCEYVLATYIYDTAQQKKCLANQLEKSKEAERACEVAQKELDRVKASRSYRIGRAITLVPRKLKRAFRSNSERKTMG